MKPKKYKSHLEVVKKQKIKHVIQPKVARKFFEQYKIYLQGHFTESTE